MAGRHAEADCGSSPRVWGTGSRRRWKYLSTTVHPHACGEQATTFPVASFNAGSSPRVWGTAGRAGSPVAGRAVHPHACGEQRDASQRRSRHYGSSPRVWGTGHSGASVRRGVRFIPTRVGNSTSMSSRFTRLTVHPHACGEQTGPVCTSHSPSGSSPRVWGTGWTSVRRCPSRPVHPHACGEQSPGRNPMCSSVGSSPRVWGTGRLPGSHGRARRFIPTRVGNSCARAVIEKSLPVHPHACGEQKPTLTFRESRVGSSPRVWGTVDCQRMLAPPGRFIPTRVGNRQVNRPATVVAPVHPHACGEQAWAQGGDPSVIGSSPRVWGTAFAEPVVAAAGRFIPTRVGNRSLRQRKCSAGSVHPHACGEQP